ncbi:chaperonin 10-like protein [Phlebopus sp. FC_14]|nr:chaperonin 10-like protein [Phlebopus sp. FC_14]
MFIPKAQVAAVVSAPRTKPEITKNYPVKPKSELAPGQCLVKLSCTGVCHTDLHASKDDWPLTAEKPLVGGHEGVGEIVAIGDHTMHSPVRVGQRVGVKWVAYSCLACEHCRKGLEQNCLNALFSGFTVEGTFCQYVVSWVLHVTPIPDSLDSFAAASILCAGLTIYRALKYSGAGIGDWVVLPGASGGLGHLAIQYAKAMGLRVLAIDTGAEKKQLCHELGAARWIDYRETSDLVKVVKEACDELGAHCAIVTANDSSGYRQAVDYLRRGGTLMAVGLPGHAPLEASTFWTVVKRSSGPFQSICIKGSYVGNRQDAIEALDIAAHGTVKVKYEVRGLSELQEVYDCLEQGKVAGRIVLDTSK